jgi:hypothetical protein
LVDSVAWETESSAGVLRRVQVITEGGTDTITGVLTDVQPVAAGRAVFGYASDSAGMLVNAWRYDPAARRLDRLPLPDDMDRSWGSPAISPDARFVAYVIVPGNGTAIAAVREFPAGRVAVRSPTITVPAGDVMSNAARWTSADAFEVDIDLADRRARVHGSSRSSTVSIDTVAAVP